MPPYYTQPPDLLAGFHAETPDADVPELRHAGEQWAPRRFFISRHCHAVWEFYLQTGGESQWDGPSETYTLRPGSFFAVPPGVFHQMHGPPPDKHHFFYAAVDLAGVFARLPYLAPLWRDAGTKPGSGMVFVPGGDTLQVQFRHLIREVSLPLPFRAAGLRLALDALVLEASRVVAAAQAGGGAPLSLTLRHPAVRRAKEVLDYQPGQPWHLADLAQITGLSAHHLVECFTREIGVSPRRYLLKVRVRLAQEMLAGSDVPVTDLALELGFSSSQHFAATFKRLTGETAQSYRAKQADFKQAEMKVNEEC